MHFISGLPRSGATLLAVLMPQNPALHAKITSGILAKTPDIGKMVDT